MARDNLLKLSETIRSEDVRKETGGFICVHTIPHHVVAGQGSFWPHFTFSERTGNAEWFPSPGAANLALAAVDEAILHFDKRKVCGMEWTQWRTLQVNYASCCSVIMLQSQLAEIAGPGGTLLNDHFSQSQIEVFSFTFFSFLFFSSIRFWPILI